METNSNDSRLALERLADALVENILSMSDEEIIAEVVEDGGDPEKIAEEGRRLIEAAIGEIQGRCNDGDDQANR